MMDPRTRLRNVTPNQWLTVAALVALLLLLLFGWCVRPDISPVESTPTPTYAPVIVLTAPPTATPPKLPPTPTVREALLPTATPVPSAVVVPIRVLETPAPTETPAPAPAETPAARPSMVQRGDAGLGGSPT